MSIRVQTEGGFAGDAYVEVRMYLHAGDGNPRGVGGGSCGFYGFDLREVRMLERGWALRLNCSPVPMSAKSPGITYM
jgi:hypothetical protein